MRAPARLGTAGDGAGDRRDRSYGPAAEGMRRTMQLVRMVRSAVVSPELLVPQTQPSGPPKLQLNPMALTPTSTATYDGTGFVNSGMLAPRARPETRRRRLR